MLFLRLFSESILQAFNSLVVNKLRTFLSLLGITIGILAIISVLTVVDSMERNVRNSISTLGDNVIYVEKWPWTFGPDYPWWKYMNRPVPFITELTEITKRSKDAEASAFMISTHKTVEHGNSNLENVDIMAVSHDYDKARDFELTEGRYFTAGESAGGRAVALIGSEVAQGLFGNKSPLAQEVKVQGIKLMVIGVFKKEGESIFGNNLDNQLLMPVNFARKLFDIRKERLNPFIMVRAKKGITNEEIKDELRGIMRSVRKLRPTVEDNFALNETVLISKGFDGLFKILGIAGWFIGGLSILVGGFGIANIMFVSVKERTNIIGIQKALGAKNYFILLQFLFEAVILCLIGGSAGLLIVYMGSVVFSHIFDMDLTLTGYNIMLGLMLSASIGVISGFIPAYTASQLNPVDAMRAV